MPRPCSVCQSAKAGEINRALLAGEPFRGVARRAALSPDAVERHAKAHIPAKLAKAAEAREVASADTLLDRLAELTRESQAILAAARRARDHDVALKAIARLERQLELAAKILGELKAPRQAIDVHVDLGREITAALAEARARRALPAVEIVREEPVGAAIAATVAELAPSGSGATAAVPGSADPHPEESEEDADDE